MTELEKAADEYANSIAQHDHNKVFSIDDFKAGANWRLEQFEKNRLAACDNMTKEEADREQEFTTEFIEKNLYAPTYSDAIEYGRKTAFEDAVEWLKEQEEMVGISFQQDFIERFKKAMEDGIWKVK